MEKDVVRLIAILVIGLAWAVVGNWLVARNRRRLQNAGKLHHLYWMFPFAWFNASEAGALLAATILTFLLEFWLIFG